ncbi:MAG TPA: IPT/TIG domain-containing protein [Bryobacteraceae bacterium]|nr:IPT/TIG domain-containing protein [Bryobacteraceae bacterium]
MRLTSATIISLLVLGAFTGRKSDAQTYTITTVAGGGSDRGDSGPAMDAYLGTPGMAVDSKGNLYIADAANNLIREVTPDGIISSIAGDAVNQKAGYAGDGGPATKALLDAPQAVAVDSAGRIYIADGSGRIRMISTSGIIMTVAGGGTDISDGIQATQAALQTPEDVAVDNAGNLFIADRDANKVRKVAPDGTISTVAGCGFCVDLGDGGSAIKASLNGPYGVAVDSKGDVFIADTLHFRIRKVTPDGNITTVAGNGAGSYSGDGGQAASAGMYIPKSVAVDSAGNLFITDTGDHRIRMVAGNGVINTIAGNGSQGIAGDGGPALDAGLNLPQGIALAGSKIYFVDGEQVIRLLTPKAGAPPSVSAGGVVSAGAFGQFTAAAPGSWIEIYGSNLSATTRSWSGDDFSGINAPTKLDATTVTIGGLPAFVDYISPTQVNAQVPSGIGTGLQPLIVTTDAAGASASYSLKINNTEPGLLAPPSFKIGGTQYVAAFFADGVTYVLPPGAIAGLPSRRAKPGDTITLYGVGFGPVSPNIPAGQIVQGKNSVSDLHIFFGSTQATYTYAGLAPDAVGLYQFNVVVPDVPASDSVPLTFSLDGTNGTQTLYIAVQNGS